MALMVTGVAFGITPSAGPCHGSGSLSWPNNVQKIAVCQGVSVLVPHGGREQSPLLLVTPGQTLGTEPAMTC